MTLTLVQGQTIKVAKYPLHNMTYAPAKCEVATSNGLGGNAFTRKYIIWPNVKGVKVIQNVAQYSRHYVTYAPAKFDVATSHG